MNFYLSVAGIHLTDTNKLITLALDKKVSIVQAKTVALPFRCRPTIVGSTLHILMILSGLRLVSHSRIYRINFDICMTDTEWDQSGRRGRYC